MKTSLCTFLLLLAAGCAVAAAPDEDAGDDEQAWRLFVALNAPHGWELWANTGEVYLPDGRDPGPRVKRAAPAEPVDERRFDTSDLKELANLRHIVGGAMAPFRDPVAGAKRLIEIRMNQVAYDYIRAQELYNLDGQVRLVKAGREVQFPSGSTEVKAHWRPIDPDQRSRYRTVSVRRADGSTQLFGLTALHIATKTAPQWAWATFEHVDNPRRTDGDGWILPSRDRFACGSGPADCNRAPRGIGLEGTVWQYYRLRGTMSRYLDAADRPRLLANSELEAGFQDTSSCMTCHSRASLAVAAGAPVHLPIFAPAEMGEVAQPVSGRRGYVGIPRPDWFEGDTAAGMPRYISMDFVWSLSKARPKLAGGS